MARISIVFASLLVLLGMGVRAGGPLDPDLPEYRRVSGISGQLKSIGSDTLNNVMSQWATRFQEFYPSVKVEIEGKGSKTAPPALIAGQAQFGPMSRPMKPSEIDDFQEAFGYEPTRLRVGIDSVAVFVHRDCPLDEISFEQLTMVFSVEGPRVTWGDLGVNDPNFRDVPVSLYGRNSASGTYEFFKTQALGGADYKPFVKEQSGSADVVNGVGRDRYSMGYSGLGYVNSDVKALRVRKGDEEASEPSLENALNGKYPLARFLNIYMNYDYRVGLDPLRAEFVRLIYSRQGQEKLLEEGFYPLSAKIALSELERLGLEP